METKQTTSLISVLAVMLLWCWVVPALGQSLDTDALPEDRIEGSFFYIATKPNYERAAWIFDGETDKIIGYAPWDPRSRRWTLFTLTGTYSGFLQATIGITSPPYFTQYLWYDRDNRYKGLFVARLGGRPATEDLKYGELGGERDLYERGNIPIPRPEYQIEVQPLRRFPSGVDASPVERNPVRSFK